MTRKQDDQRDRKKLESAKAITDLSHMKLDDFLKRIMRMQSKKVVIER